MTTYERLMAEAKAEYEKQVVEGRRLKVRELLDNVGLEKKRGAR